METAISTANQLLMKAFGESANFREGQLEAIKRVQEPGAKLLVVQRTGWGKSIVYFIATALNRNEGRGLTLILSPLLALMRNQIEMAAKFGLRAATINSTNPEDWPVTEDLLERNELDVLFVSPERLANQQFRQILEALTQKIGLLVIDEAHCISDWGHDFRPDYRRIVGLVHRLPKTCSILASTATATNRVIEDVLVQLGADMVVQRGTVLRESLKISVFEIHAHAERLAWLEKYLPKFPGSGIVYTLTIHDANQVADFLNQCGIEAKPYHSMIPHEERLEVEGAFATNQIKAVVATSALGMGYDKADVGFVVHYQLPASILAYYQQIGRAGRMMSTAFACLLFSEGDQEIVEHFAASSLPPDSVFLHLLANASDEPRSVKEMGSGLKISSSILLQALSILEVDEAISRNRDGTYQLPASPKPFDSQRYIDLRQQRLTDSNDMLQFARAKVCRMKIIGEALGDSAISDCGKCDNCQPHKPPTLDPARIRFADVFLRSARFTIEPRIMLPAFGGDQRSTKIPDHLRLEPGIALSIYNDSGYGRMVKEAKYRGHKFENELVQASAETIREAKLNPDWVAAVPSHNNNLVPDFAKALAKELGIPYVDAVKKQAENLPQKHMIRSHAQYANVADAFQISSKLPGRCLLIDDIVDSGWTLTVIGMALRKAGCSSVVPFALASAKPRSQN